MSSYLLPAGHAVLNQDFHTAPLGTLDQLWNQQSPYNRQALKTGIVHFGPGRFFRGHLARIVHQYLAQKRFQDQRWGICGVSLKSRHSIATLQPQNYLYSSIERHHYHDYHETAEIIGSICQIVDGIQQRNDVLNLMTSPAIHLVTLTVTQAGYCLDSCFNLDVAHNQIAQDLASPTTPTTPIGFIVEALRQRRDRGMAPFTTLSCDNLPQNGKILQQAILAYAEQIDPQLADYIYNHAAFPNTVVDRIVPRSQDSDPSYPERLLQVRDRDPIVTEPFWQLVVEENFSSDRPAWEDVGVTMTTDITPFLHLKSRFLNALHSFIACLALRAGIQYVHEALRLPEFRLFMRQLMTDIAVVTPVSEVMCEQYIEQVLLRLSNEALPDTIERLVAETSRKLNKYIVPILKDAYYQKSDLKRLMLPIAAWILTLRESATELGTFYHAKDKPSVIAAAQGDFSQIIGLEPGEFSKAMNRDCDRALQDLRANGLFATLRDYCEENFQHETISAA